MEARVADHVWSLEEVIALPDAKINYVFIKVQRLTIIPGLIGVAANIILFFLPALAHYFFNPLSSRAEAEIFIYSTYGQICLSLVMAGFGIHFYRLRRTNNFKYLILGIYLAPLLLGAIFVAVIWGLANWQIHQLALKYPKSYP